MIRGFKEPYDVNKNIIVKSNFEMAKNFQIGYINI